MLLRTANLLYLTVDAKLTANLDFLLNVAKIPPSRLPRVIEKAPSLLGLSPSKNMKPIVDFLAAPGVDNSGLSIGAERVGVMLSAQPQILMSSLDDKLKPCVAFLRGR